METLAVPEMLGIPDPASHDFDAVAVADFLMTALLLRVPAMLHAEYASGSVRWFVRDAEHRDVCIAESKNVGEFRSVLARFGCHYMGTQLYGGHADLNVVQNQKVYSCGLDMSNLGKAGFWIRVYAHEIGIQPVLPL